MTTLIAGSRVLITGAASGLGLAFTQLLSQRGCQILATDIAEETPAALADLPGVTYRRLDVTSDVDFDSVHTWVVETWNGIDAVFNNAGVAAGGRIELSQMDQWQWIVDINLLGVVRGCRTFVPMLKDQRSGLIVNTASAAGLIHPPTMSEYNAVKAGVVAVSETLKHELSPYGVQVSVICPTFFKTNLSSSLQGKDESARRAATKLIDGAKRTAEQVAAASLKQIDAGKHIVLPDLEAKAAYGAKRFARPLYYFAMSRAAKQMAAREAKYS